MDRRRFLIGGGAVVLAVGTIGGIERARMGSMPGYAAAQAELRRGLAQNSPIRDLVRFAALAPSGHNTQPWRFQVSEQELAILPDFTRRTPVVDPDDHHLWISLGCAAETLAIAAHQLGRGGELIFGGPGSNRLSYMFGSEQQREPKLFGAITQRQSTRSVYTGQQASTAQLEQLTKAAQIDGVAMALVTAPPMLDRLADLVATGNSAQWADPAFVRELRHWLRFNPHAALAHGDGLFSAASGSPVLPSWLGPTLFNLTFDAAADNTKYRDQLRSSAGMAVFAGAKADPEHWIKVGRAAQRFLLQATALGMKAAFVNQPVEVAALRSDLAALAGLPGLRPDLLIRFGFGDAMPYSPRRPVAAVVVP